MTPVKNQYYCGSCYAFAATSVAEYYIKKQGGNLVLSQQNLIDCDTTCFGCDGGWPSNSLTYIRDEGVAEDSSYMYEANKKECRKDIFPPISKIPNFCEVDLGDDEEKLKALVGSVGPVAGVIHATDGLYNYGDGVFYDTTCNSNAFDHAIVSKIFKAETFFQVLNF
jgi:C1A family cysteine protease